MSKLPLREFPSKQCHYLQFGWQQQSFQVLEHKDFLMKYYSTSVLFLLKFFFQSVSVGEEVYNSKWYERDYKFQKSLTVIIARTAKPITLHAGPFAQLSNTFLLAVLSKFYFNNFSSIFVLDF